MVEKTFKSGQEAQDYCPRRIEALMSTERLTRPVATSVAQCEILLITNDGLVPPLAMGYRDDLVQSLTSVPMTAQGTSLAAGLYPLMIEHDCDFFTFGYVNGSAAHDLADSLVVMVQERERFSLGQARVYRHRGKYTFGGYKWQVLLPENPGSSP